MQLKFICDVIKTVKVDEQNNESMICDTSNIDDNNTDMEVDIEEIPSDVVDEKIELPTIHFNLNPVKTCGCVVHLIRPGKRPICCGDAYKIADLANIALTKFYVTRGVTQTFRLVVRIDCDRGVTMDADIPYEVAGAIQAFGRPLQVYLLKQGETIPQALNDTIQRRRRIRTEGISTRMLSHLNNVKINSRNDDVGDQVKIFDFEP